MLIPLALLLTLVGCGSGDQGPLPPCPVVFPVAEARELTRFAGQGRDLTDVLFEARVEDVALICGYLDDVIEVLAKRPPDLHVVVTGRNAKEKLIEIADLVTEMTEIKHHFRADFKAQTGIEF